MRRPACRRERDRWRAPAHVPSTVLRETYLLFLISDRDEAGNGIGSALVRRAVREAG